MYNILSLVRNNITRNNVFLPQVDFGLFAFGINKDSLEGSGPKRERAEADFKTDEPQLETQVALPSPLSLEDFIMPSNAGSLENKAFFASSAQSSAIIFGYLSFDSNSRIINPVNPKYLVYRVIEFPTQNYASYAMPQNGAAYQSQAAYESATKFVFSQAIQQAEVKLYSFPLVKPTDLYKAQFAYAETNAVPNYDAPRYTIALNHDFWLTLTKTHYSFSLRHAKLSQSAHPQNLNQNYDMPKHAIEVLSSNFWQSSSYFVGTHSQVLPKYAVNNLDNSFSKPIARSYARKDLPKFATQKEIPRKTLDLIVARTPNIELSTFRLTYTVILPFQMPTKPIKTRGVEFIAQAFFVYAKQNQQTLYNETRQPNHDAPQQSLNVMSSGFWRNSSYYKGEYKSEENIPIQNPSKTPNTGNGFYRRKKKKENYQIKRLERSEKQKSNIIAKQPKNSKLKGVARKSTDYLINLVRNNNGKVRYPGVTFKEFYANSKSLYSKIKAKIKSEISRYGTNHADYKPRANPVEISELANAGISLNNIHQSSNGAEPKLRTFDKPEDIAQHLESKYGCKVSYIAIDVPTAEIIASMNANEMVSNGSMSKIFIIKALLELSQQGKINLNDKINIRNSLRPKNYTAVEKESITYMEAMREVVTDENRNSNWYTNLLMEKIGLKRLTRIQTKLGYNDTIFVDYYLPRALYRGNKTSVDNTGKLVLDALIGRGLDEEHHKILLETLNGKDRLYIVRDPKNLDGLDPESVLMKHGQSEQDVGVVYRMKGVYDGKEFDRVVVFNVSDIKKRIVDGKYKKPTPFGMELMREFLDFSRQLSRIIQMPYFSVKQKPA